MSAPQSSMIIQQDKQSATLRTHTQNIQFISHIYETSETNTEAKLGDLIHMIKASSIKGNNQG